MALLFVVRNFQYRGMFIRAGEEPEDATITVKAEELREEADRGRHPKTKRWLSPLLNHCQPADEEAARIMGAEPVKIAAEPDDENEIEDVRAEFDALGKAYDRRWGLDRLRIELKKARKEVGV